MRWTGHGSGGPLPRPVLRVASAVRRRHRPSNAASPHLTQGGGLELRPWHSRDVGVPVAVGQNPAIRKWNRLGVVVEATERLSRWAFEDLGLHRLRLCHSTTNPASCRVAEKAGYSFEGIQRSALPHEDGWHDEHLHSLVRGDI
jgi:hypothetical protein